MSARAELVHQLQCVGANTERAAEEIADAHAAEVLAADGQQYPGQLAMLTGLVATLRAVATHGDIDDVRKLLDEHQRDEQDAYAEAGERR
ncbi:hypothetical protein [Streptomyces sp. NPDC001492]